MRKIYVFLAVVISVGLAGCKPTENDLSQPNESAGVVASQRVSPTVPQPTVSQYTLPTVKETTTSEPMTWKESIELILGLKSEIEKIEETEGGYMVFVKDVDGWEDFFVGVSLLGGFFKMKNDLYSGNDLNVEKILIYCEEITLYISQTEQNFYGYYNYIFYHDDIPYADRTLIKKAYENQLTKTDILS